MKYVVIDQSTFQTLEGMPTGMLISEGGGEAWMELEGIWRFRDDRHDPPGTDYRKVRVARLDSYYVEVEVQNVDPSNPDGDEPEPYVLGVHVEAEGVEQAKRLAPAKAIERAQEIVDAPYTATVVMVEEL